MPSFLPGRPSSGSRLPGCVLSGRLLSGSLLLGAVLPGCVHAPSTPRPSPIQGAAVYWFDLHGADRIDLLESCIERCPRDEGGVPVASLTTWSVSWSWTRGAGEACSVADATVDVAVSVELPRWSPPPDAEVGLSEAWERWHEALQRHEQGHVDRAHAFAEEAEETIVAGGCEGTETAGEAIVTRLRTVEKAYDEETRNGQVQGANFWGLSGVLEIR